MLWIHLMRKRIRSIIKPNPNKLKENNKQEQIENRTNKTNREDKLWKNCPKDEKRKHRVCKFIESPNVRTHPRSSTARVVPLLTQANMGFRLGVNVQSSPLAWLC